MQTEFQYADFGDARLTDRLVQIGDELGSAPAESIPIACEDLASTKATYRFCDNESVNSAKIIASHRQAQLSRIKEMDQLLVVSDTTELIFPRHPSKEGLGDIGTSEMDLEGVKLHSTIGIDPQTHNMTGVIDQQALIEDRQAVTTHDANGKDEPILLETRHEKWIRGDRRARTWLPTDVRPIFIHDRGADDFSLYAEIIEEMDNAGFVVRAQYNRWIRTPAGEDDKLFDWSGDLPEEGRTTLDIQQAGGRKARTAELSIALGTCQLPSTQAAPAGADPLSVNVVRVDEIGKSEDPIQWVLLTTESVGTLEEALTILEYYGLRWRIEEWHKALKTGCRIEERQLQTWERMDVLLGVYSVIAWKVLELRNLARGNPSADPEVLLSDAERAVLEAKHPELRGESGKAYAVSVAKLGGYLDRNSDPPPGWQAMWKGLQKLRMWAEGYELGTE
ncbi:transposase [Halalkaliarchaeum desulfuricum]|uniref:Transposase n=1 Tax=Halalkaliarchaeum desulfuricum TaxID=2055893 RepID=A0A343TNF4_9EURY|nr:transposase [Halalkaliarchaeum desulfuricum]